MYSSVKKTGEYVLNKSIFRVTYEDITKINAEVLVSSDDNYLTMGGGVSYSILEKAGYLIQNEARKHIPLKVGDVAVTSAGNLPAKYIFHAVTIDYFNSIFPSEQIISDITKKCMELADALGVKTIAFPMLGTGTGRFPFELAVNIITKTITKYLMGDTQIELINLTLFTKESSNESNMDLLVAHSIALASIQSKQNN